MEVLDLYDEDRLPLGKTIVRGQRQEQGEYRIAVHICVFSSDGKMLIQRRQPFKEGWPGLWDVTVGGNAVAGETSLQAAERELFEEIGLRLPLPRRHLSVSFDGGFDDIYFATCDVDPASLVLQEEEVAEVRWATEDEILDMVRSKTFIPFYESFIHLLFAMRKHYGVLEE